MDFARACRQVPRQPRLPRERLPLTALTLARSDDLDRLLPLVAAFHAEEGITLDEADRRTALEIGRAHV